MTRDEFLAAAASTLRAASCRYGVGRSECRRAVADVRRWTASALAAGVGVEELHVFVESDGLGHMRVALAGGETVH